MKNNRTKYNESDFNLTEIVEETFFNRGKIVDCRDSNHKPYDGEAHQSIYLFNDDFPLYVEEKGSVKGYKGPHYSSSLPIDFDGDTYEDSLKEVIRLLEKLDTHYNIQENGIKIYYSGNRGVHIVISRSLINTCSPSKHLFKVDKKFIQKLTRGIKFVDLSIYKTTGLLRKINSRHPKTGLFKIPLTKDELLNLSTEEIRRLAAGPRTIENENTTVVEPSENLSELFNRCEAEYLKKLKASSLESDATKTYTLTDEGNRDRFIDMNSNELRYNINTDRWIYWNNQIWMEDKDGILSKSADKVTSNMALEFQRNSNSTLADANRRHLKRARSGIGRKEMIGLAKSDSRMIIKISELDRQKELFNCQNCTIKLNVDGSHSIYNHSSEDYLTKISAVKHDPTILCTQWIEFLKMIFNDDEELIKYIQKALGYSLTGYTDEDCFFFLQGDGANGKSTFLEGIEPVYGDYWAKSKIDIIMKKRGESTGMDVARLVGARLVVLSEAGIGMQFDEAKLKDLTGGDTMTVRNLFKSFFQFKPEFKLWMYANFMPKVKGMDYGIRRRYRIIPFNIVIPMEKRKPRSQVLSTFKSEQSGILNWILEGYKLYRQEGLLAPKYVESVTNEYFANLDIISRFIDECIIIDPHKKIKVLSLYESYRGFCTNVGEFPWSMKVFNVEFEKKDFEKRRIGSGGYFWLGVDFTPRPDTFIPGSSTLDPTDVSPTVETDLPGLEFPKES